MLPDGNYILAGQCYWTRGKSGDPPRLARALQKKTYDPVYPWEVRVIKDPMNHDTWFTGNYTEDGTYLRGETSSLDLVAKATHQEAEDYCNPYSKPNPVEMAVSIEPEDWEQPFVRGGE
jgi:hypothetical protein